MCWATKKAAPILFWEFRGVIMTSVVLSFDIDMEELISGQQKKKRFFSSILLSEFPVLLSHFQVFCIPIPQSLLLPPWQNEALKKKKSGLHYITQREGWMEGRVEYVNFSVGPCEWDFPKNNINLASKNWKLWNRQKFCHFFRSSVILWILLKSTLPSESLSFTPFVWIKTSLNISNS